MNYTVTHSLAPTFYLFVGASAFVIAIIMLAAIYRAEKSWYNTIVPEGRRMQDLAWKWRHASRWLCVATLYVLGFHNLHWWLLDTDWVTLGHYGVLTDIMVLLFSLAHSLATLKSIRRKPGREVKT